MQNDFEKVIFIFNLPHGRDHKWLRSRPSRKFFKKMVTGSSGHDLSVRGHDFDC